MTFDFAAINLVYYSINTKKISRKHVNIRQCVAAYV